MTAPKGHGWVRPLPGGEKARCGGPNLCTECRREQAELYRSGEVKCVHGVALGGDCDQCNALVHRHRRS